MLKCSRTLLNVFLSRKKLFSFKAVIGALKSCYWNYVFTVCIGGACLLPNSSWKTGVTFESLGFFQLLLVYKCWAIEKKKDDHLAESLRDEFKISTVLWANVGQPTASISNWSIPFTQDSSISSGMKELIRFAPKSAASLNSMRSNLLHLVGW